MESEYTTIRISKIAKKTIDEFQQRTGTNFTEDFDLIMAELQKVLDLQEDGKRLLWMVDMYNKDNVPKVIIRVSDAMASSFDEIPEELRSDILKGFGYDEKFHELPKPEQPRKLSHCEQIQKQHDEDVAKEEAKGQ